MARFSCKARRCFNRIIVSTASKHRKRNMKTINQHAGLPLGLLMSIGALGIAGLSAHAWAARKSGPESVLFSSELTNAPGSRLTAIVVRYGPGEKSPAHHHAGSVFAYVLSGSIRSENSATGPARVYKTGESFFEPVGSIHRVSENASATQPASLLAVFVAPEQAKLTAPEQQ
jgi:quercetin dioxygenase-like cupin family protein